MASQGKVSRSTLHHTTIEKYQITSDEKRMHVSAVIQGDVPVVKLSQAHEMQIVNDPKPLTNDQKFELPKLELPFGGKSNEKGEESDVQCKKSDISQIVELAIHAVGN